MIRFTEKIVSERPLKIKELNKIKNLLTPENVLEIETGIDFINKVQMITFIVRRVK